MYKASPGGIAITNHSSLFDRQAHRQHEHSRNIKFSTLTLRTLNGRNGRRKPNEVGGNGKKVIPTQLVQGLSPTQIAYSCQATPRKLLKGKCAVFTPF